MPDLRNWFPLSFIVSATFLGSALAEQQPKASPAPRPEPALSQEGIQHAVYTDALTVPGQVRTITIPAWAQPKQAYEIAVVKSTGDRADAVAFVRKVMSKSGQALLKKAGFLPPPPGTTYGG